MSAGALPGVIPILVGALCALFLVCFVTLVALALWVRAVANAEARHESIIRMEVERLSASLGELRSAIAAARESVSSLPPLLEAVKALEPRLQKAEQRLQALNLRTFGEDE